MKKILFLSDNFPPEVNAPASRTFDHCKIWSEKGYDVTVITSFPNFPIGKVFKGYKNKFYDIEKINGIRVIRVWTYISYNKGFYKRILDYMSYGFMSFIFGLFIKTDIIIGTSPQFFTAISARLLSFFKRRPWIMEIRDLWPESIVTVGSLSSDSLIFKILKTIEIHLYKSASRIVVVTKNFKKYLIENNINSDKIIVIRNGINTEIFNSKIKKDFSIIKKLKLNNKYIFSYIGTHGLAHNLDFILNCSKKTDEKIHYIFIGEGAEKNNLINRTSNENIKNITFLDLMPKSEIVKYIKISDAAIINLKRSNTFKNVIPSKIFENVALKVPILLGLEGESKDLIKKYGVGLCYKPENIQSFLLASKDILNFKNLNYEKKTKIFVKKFDRKNLAEKMIKFIDS